VPAEGDLVAGKYRIEGVLGRGGMGVVYRALNEMTERRVALKWMLPEFAAHEDHVRRFLREARAAGRIDHPNVVAIYDVGTEGAAPFLVMELLQGESLSKLLSSAPLTPPDAVMVLMPALRGIAAAHAKGIVHRDLKPDNVFVVRGADGTPIDSKVLDFGISKVQEKVEVLTRTGAVMGTPHYMAPEQIRGVKEIDHRVDVYSMGVVLYETLCGEPPFQAETYSALAVMIATEDPRPLEERVPGMPAGLAAVVRRAMARSPENRYPDIASLGRDLEPFGQGVRYELRNERWSRPLSTVDPNGSTMDSGPGLGRQSGQRERISGDAETMAQPVLATPNDTALRAEIAPTPAPALLTGETPRRRSLLPWIAAGVAVIVIAVICVIAMQGSGEDGGAREVVRQVAPPPPVVPPAAPEIAVPAAPSIPVLVAPPAAEPVATPEPATTATPPAEARGKRARPAGRRGTAGPAAPSAPSKRSSGRTGSLSTDDF
jgi:serine/threonine-protein kinase